MFWVTDANKFWWPELLVISAGIFTSTTFKVSSLQNFQWLETEMNRKLIISGLWLKKHCCSNLILNWNGNTQLTTWKNFFLVLWFADYEKLNFFQQHTTGMHTCSQDNYRCDTASVVSYRSDVYWVNPIII